MEIDTSKKASQNKPVPKDIRAYVLDEFKDILFPKKTKNKYEQAHDKAVAMKA